MTGDVLKDKDTFLREAESCLEQGLYQAAQDMALEWLLMSPGDADASIIVCHAWMRMGKLDKVKQMLREVDEAILHMSRIYARMGDICRQSGLNGEAKTFYRRFLALNPDSDLAQDVSERLDAISPPPGGDFPDEDEGEAVSRIPGAGFRTVTMAELYVKQGHLGLAAEVLHEILDRDPANRRAAELLEEIQQESDMRSGKRKESGKVVDELRRWLGNLDRIRNHAA